MNAVDWTTFISAFGGALAVVLVQWIKEYRDYQRRSAVSGNEALVALSDRLDTLFRIRDQHLDAVAGHPVRHLALPAFHVPPAGMQIEFNRLGFLLDSDPPRADLFQALLLAEKAAQTALNLLTQRTDFHLKVVQPRLEGVLMKNGDSEKLPFELLEATLGPVLTVQLRSHTDNLYESVPEAIERCSDAFNALREGLMERFSSFAMVGLEIRQVPRPGAG